MYRLITKNQQLETNFCVINKEVEYIYKQLYRFNILGV